MRKEPAVIIGAIGTAVGAILVLLTSFGLDISAEQQAAILGVVAAVGPIAVAVVTRQFVFSPESTKRAVAAAEVAKLVEPDDDAPKHSAD